jgi:hypothetical protein
MTRHKMIEKVETSVKEAYSIEVAEEREAEAEINGTMYSA